MSCVPRMLPSVCQMADDVLNHRVHLRARDASSAVLERSRASRASLRPSVVIARGVILAGVDLLRTKPLVAGDKLRLKRRLLLGHRGRRRLWAFPPSRCGPRKVEHLGRLHVRERPEHLLQLRQVHEPSKAAAGPEASPRPGDFHRVDHLAEGSRPGVEVLDAAAP